MVSASFMMSCAPAGKSSNAFRAAFIQEMGRVLRIIEFMVTHLSPPVKHTSSPHTPRPLNRQLLGIEAKGGGDFVAAGLAQA